MENKGEEKNRGRMKSRKNILIFSGLLIGILLIVLVLATAPGWIPGSTAINYTTLEGGFYYHNLSKNITGFNNDVNFQINPTVDKPLYWTNESGRYTFTLFNIASNWIRIYNSSTGNLTINSTYDNQTGFFEIPIQATNTSDPAADAIITTFEFIINATNDAPEFLDSSINSTYNLTQNRLFLEYINATDEEEHYPLYFNISFLNNCTHAGWSDRSDGENCSIFNLTNILNTSASMNFTPVRNEVGYYWANITVTDFGENYSCPHIYCDNVTYEQNKTTYYSEIIKFNIFSALEINISNCTNKIFQENESGTCQINITTKEDADLLNISSLGFLKNYDASVLNSSWFYADSSTNSANFTKTVTINVTPQKTEIGNWTINFTVQDITANEDSTEQIYVYVNRTLNDAPEIIGIEDMEVSVDLEKRINLIVYDDDFLIPDKNTSFGGYNETITFNVTILNQSNLSQELNLNGFDVEILNMPVVETNRTEAKIQFTPNSSELGDYTINLSVNDLENSFDFDLFNLSIVSNNFPYWNQTSYSFDLVVNSSSANTASFYLNLTDNYVNDSDVGNVLTFANDSDAFPRFNLTSEGIINFTPYKEDVGNWSFNVTATDSLGLQNTTTFAFNITNTNSAPAIKTPIFATNASVDVNSNVNATEDKYTQIILWVEDDDFKIPSGQKSFYNESLNITTTILNSSGSAVILDLFNFTKTNSFPTSNFPNKTEYEATFTPNQIDIGSYNVTVNITDASNISDILEFNLTILSSNDAPVLMNLTNKTSAVNRTFYYNINATDEEDGNETLGNLTFSYDFINGTDFINNNQTIFNTTSGILNLTFNSSHAGSYRINITVNDSSSSENFNDFWIYVYDSPNISNPSSLEIFNLTENETYNFNFTVNHSIEDNLTYLFYVDLITYNGSEFNYSDLILRENTTYYGNGTNLTWQFTPNFTDESYGKLKNLSLIVYPSNSNLTNAVLINSTLNLKLNISHANYPINFSGTIANQSKEKTKKIYIDLEDYFSSLDYDDAYYNRTVNFTILNSDTNLSPSGITSNFPYSNWTLSLASSSGVALEEDLFINSTEFDSNNNLLSSKYSNSFNTEFTEPSQTTTPPVGGGGGGSSIPVSFKIIHPGEIFVSQYEKVDIPLKLENKGSKAFQRINLVNTLLFNSTNSNQGIGSFDIDYFDFLKVGETKNFSLSLLFNTAILGEYEVMVNASSLTPRYNDGIKIKVHVQELNKSKVEEILIFTEEFITQNPECAEITEIVNEAKKHFEEGDLINAKLKAEEAVNACKDAISQVSIPKERKTKEQLLKDYLNYLILISFFAFIVGIVYYFIKRRAFIKKYKE